VLAVKAELKLSLPGSWASGDGFGEKQRADDFLLLAP